jgi:Tfp pilus assembly protein PilN
MLRTNLATRPFYNERLVHVALGVALALIAAFTIFNVTHILELSRAQAELSASAARNEARAAELSNKAASVRGSIDPKALKQVTEAAVEANRLIDARAFSWTALFNDIEETLPPGVMLSSISQSVSRTSDERDAGLLVQFIVRGRTVEDVDTFIGRLEQTGRFRRVLAPSEQITEDDLIETTIVGEYRQVTLPQKPAAPSSATPAAATPTSATAAAPPSAAPPSVAPAPGGAR